MNTDEFILLNQNDPLMTPDEMATAMNVSVGYLANLRSEGRGPTFVRMGQGPRSRIRYLRQQILGPAKGTE
jgi:hypothetical protein